MIKNVFLKFKQKMEITYEDNILILQSFGDWKEMFFQKYVEISKGSFGCFINDKMRMKLLMDQL